MRIDLECSCGAKIVLAYDVGRYAHSSETREALKAKELLNQFRKDHKVCLTVKAANSG